jgi:hypothetical protein
MPPLDEYHHQVLCEVPILDAVAPNKNVPGPLNALLDFLATRAPKHIDQLNETHAEFSRLHATEQ